MVTVDELKMKYPDANAWQMGDSPELANELAALIKKGIKTASCGSYASYQKEEFAPRIGSYNIILNGQDVPVCVTRLVSMRLVRFCDVTAEFARKEGEGGFAPIFPDICYHLTHYRPAAADIPVASDNPAHYADAIRYNARTPLQGSLLPLTRLV